MDRLKKRLNCFYENLSKILFYRLPAINLKSRLYRIKPGTTVKVKIIETKGMIETIK